MADLVLLRVPLGEGSEEIVEVQVARSQIAATGESGVVLASDDGRSFITSAYTFAGAIAKALPALKEVVNGLRDQTHAPDELTLELGLMIGGETGIIFTKGTAEANFSVTMTWRGERG